MPLKIQDSVWFIQLGGPAIGIVLGYDELTKKYKCYIGTGFGQDQEQDEQKILGSGAKFSLTAATFFFGIHIMPEKKE